MHKLLFSLAIASISLTSCAQDSHLDKFYRKYQSAAASPSGSIGSDKASPGKTNITISSDNGSSLSLDPSNRTSLKNCSPSVKAVTGSGSCQKKGPKG